MSKKELTADEVTISLTNTIMNLQNELKVTRDEYIEKIKKLDETIKAKDDEINDLKEKLAGAKRRKEDQAIIDGFRQEREMINTELATKVQELTSALLNISTLKNQIEIQKQNIMEFEMKKKKALEENTEKHNEKYKILENQFFLLQKQLDSQNEENKIIQNKLKEKENIIEDLNKNIQELNDKIKKSEEQNNSLLKFVKEMRENEEKLAKIRKRNERKRRKISEGKTGNKTGKRKI